MNKTQKLLAQDQLEAFYHDEFVKNQAADFISLTGSFVNPSSEVMVDIGGGGLVILQAPLKTLLTYRYGYWIQTFGLLIYARKKELMRYMMTH